MPWAVLGACVHALSLRKGSYRTKLFHDDQEMYDAKLLSAKAAQLMHEVRIEMRMSLFCKHQGTNDLARKCQRPPQ